MIYGFTPFNGYNNLDLYNNILSKSLKFPTDDSVPKYIIDLIRKMLIVDESLRISWEEIFVYPGLGLKFESKKEDYQN